MANRQIGWSTESNLLWQIGNQIDRMTGVIGSTLSTFVPQSRTLTINGVTYDLSANRSWTVAGGISGTGAAGQVTYFTGASSVAGSNNLFWDSTNNRLGIGTNTPLVKLHIFDSAAGDTVYLENNVGIPSLQTYYRNNSVNTPTNTQVGSLLFATYFNDIYNPPAQEISGIFGVYLGSGLNRVGGIDFRTHDGSGLQQRMRLNNVGNLLIGSTVDNGQRVQINGDALINGVTTLQVSSNAGSNPNLLVETTNGDSAVLKVKNNEGSVDVTTNNGVSNFTNTNTAISIQNGNEGVRIASGSGGIGPNTSAMLDVISTTRGFLPPRMTNAQRVAISSPAVGLIVYCTDATEGLYQYINNAWVNITGVVTNRQTASYTLALGDSNDLVEMNVATANNLTVPLDSAVAFPVGTKIDIAQYGAGQTTVVATGGVTIRSAGGALKLAAQYSGATLVKIATNEWYLFGDITV